MSATLILPKAAAAWHQGCAHHTGATETQRKKKNK